MHLGPADGCGFSFSRKGDYAEYQQPGPYNLAQQVAPVVAYGRRRAEDSELGAAVFSRVEMVFVYGIDQTGSAEGAQYLDQTVWQYPRPWKTACNGQAQRYGRVEVGSGIRTGNEQSAHYCEAPGHSYDRPAGTFGLRFLQAASGNHSVTEKYEYESSYELE